MGRLIISTVIVVVFVLMTPVATQEDAAPPAIDHHQHFFSPTIAARAEGIQVIDAGRLIELLDAAGIRRAAVLSLAYQFGNPNRPPVENEYERVKAENDWTSAQVIRFRDRLRGFCSVNPLRDYAIDEIARCAKDPQLRFGLKLHLGNSDVDLLNAQHADRLREVFRTANARNMAILIHMRSSVTRKRPYGAAQARAFLDNVLPAAADVPVQIAHLMGAGGYDDPLVDEALAIFVDAVDRQDPRVARLYFDVSGVAGIGNWTAKAPLIAKRIREVGVGRVLFGSDGAGGGNNTPQQAWSAFRQLPLSPAEIRTIAQNVAPYMK